MMIKKLLFRCSLFAIATLTAQTPCENGMAGDYPCNGYDLLHEAPATSYGGNNANDSWGWTDPVTGSEYALIGLDNGTAFINIDDPVNPVYLGRLDSHTGSTIWRDIKTYNNYAFIVSEASGHGMQVFDLTRLRDVTSPPEEFTEDAHYNGFGNGHNIVINEEEGYAYGVGTNTFNGGPHFIDISDPLNPTAAGGYSSASYSHDGQVVTYNGPDADYAGREIYIGSNESFVSIVDITDKANPTAISTFTYSSTVYTHQGWFTEDQRYFLLGDEIDEINFGFNTRTIVVDLLDLDNPTLHMEYEGPSQATDHNGYVKDDIFYLASYSAGVRMIDISDIENQNMTEIGFFDMYTSNNLSGYNGAWNIYPYFESGTLLVTTLRYSDNNFIPGMLLIASSELSTEEIEDTELTIYPNPTSDTFSLSGMPLDSNKVVIYDLSGRLLYDQVVAGSDLLIDVSQYRSGIYMVQVNDTITKKLIVN